MRTARVFVDASLWWLLSDGMVAFCLLAGGYFFIALEPGERIPEVFLSLEQLGRQHVWLGIALWTIGLVVLPWLQRRWSASRAFLGLGQRIRLSAVPPISGVEAYGWWEWFPDAPLRNVAHDRHWHEVPTLLLPISLGFCLGACAWPEFWISFGLFMAFCGFVPGVILALANRPHPNESPKSVVGVSAWREARVTQGPNGTLAFIVTSRPEPSSVEAVIIADLCWASVTEFTADTYRRFFGLQPDEMAGQDWNIVTMAPAVGRPLLVTESFYGVAHVYQVVTELTARFGSIARTKFEREAQEQAESVGGGPMRSDVPIRLD